ncbi:hypothetical protein OV450_1392 [Actinobacteria bacterium OV450]|nr:hypothetical protein OV450_1392 [Actinobacteria bacterium OV450]
MRFTTLVIPASEIRTGDTIRGYYRPDVTMTTAVAPGSENPDWSDISLRAGRLGIPYKATQDGRPALASLRTSQRFTDHSPILITRALARPAELGDAIGRIAAFAAMSLHESFPHLSLEGLVEAFTSSAATSMLAARFLSGQEHGLTPGQAAAEAGTALIRGWAEARLETRARPDREAAIPDEMKLVLQGLATLGPRMTASALLFDAPCPEGGYPCLDFVQHAIRKGWAVRDTSVPVHLGQPVTLTEAGLAALAV